MDADDPMDGIRTPRSILRFAFPTVVVMVCISSYSIVDGVIVSNMIGTDALAALNIVMPVASLFTAFGFMLANGGSAYVAKEIGEGDVPQARRDFAGVSVLGVLISLAMMALVLPLADPLVDLLGADETLHGYAVDYLSVYIWFAPVAILQFIFMQFLIVAGRPGLSLAVSVASGLANLALDVVFIGPLGMGISGAALAAGIGSLIAFAMGAAYFVWGRNSPVRFARPSLRPRMVSKVCANGASEMVSELSGSITTLLFNLVMMECAGADGVSAITIIMYVQFLAIAVVLGYSSGVAPLMSYNYGAGRTDVMRTLYRTSMSFVAAVSVAIFALMELFGWAVVDLFASGSEDVREIARRGVLVHSFGYLFMGANCYASSLFTSLNNGLLSAVVSFIRGLCLLAPMIVLLPTALGTDGVWLAVPVTELVTLAVSLPLMRRMGPRYGYSGGAVASS